MTNKIQPKITIGIITRNRCESLMKTLNALARLNFNNYEIIVVDNESSDSTAEIIKKLGVKYLFSPKKFGFARSRQLIVNDAKGDFLIWCDDDCIPDREWLNAFVKKFNTDDRIGLIGGKIINVGFSTDKQFKGRSSHAYNGLLNLIEDPFTAQYFGNANLGLRLEALRNAGGYDSFFVGGYEEIDVADSLRKFGYKIVYCDDAEVFHYHQDISYKKGRFFWGGSLMRIYFFLKHHRPSDLKEVVLFIKREFLLLINDLNRGFRQLVSGIIRLNGQRINIAGIELFNSISSRLAIPWLWFKVKGKSSIMENR